MPAQSSSPIDAAIGHLASLARGAEDPPGPLAMLAKVADPPTAIIAVDGKTLRGSGHGGKERCHLLAALDHCA